MSRDQPPLGAPTPLGVPAPRVRRDPSGGQVNEPTDPGALDGETVSIVLAANGEAERVGKYVVRGVLGRGGMGVVYEVDGTRENRPLALKTIETRFLELSDGAAAQRFRHEIKVLERLVHPGVVRLFDAGIARHPLGYDLAYYVMEKLEGDTLVPGIRSGTLFAPDEALRVLGGLAESLDYLQANGVLHRDIKPGNVFLDRGGRVVLVDFGLARSQEFTRLTLAGQIVGTFSYMSPERLAGQAVDVAADVFAVGVVFFQMLTARHPFGAGTPPELMAAIHRGVDWPESFARIERSAELRSLILSMLAIDARARPSPNALVERVRSLRGRRGGGGARVTRTPGTVTETYPVASEAAPSRPPVTVLIDGANPARPTRDPAAVPARTQWAGPRATEPPARSTRTRIATRTASGGPTWLMFGLVCGSLACLAFTLGLLVGHGARARSAPYPSGSPRAVDPTAAAPVTPETTLPTDYEVLLRLARTAQENDDTDATIRYGVAATAAQPAASDPHRILGDAYARAGRSALAVKHYRLLVELRDGDVDAQVTSYIAEHEARSP